MDQYMVSKLNTPYSNLIVEKSSVFSAAQAPIINFSDITNKECFDISSLLQSRSKAPRQDLHRNLKSQDKLGLRREL